jgi:hypothetical protein
MGVGIPGLVPSGKACSFGICPLSPKVHGRNSEIIGLMFMKYRGRSSMERFEHKGIVFFVKPDREEGFYSFRFILNKKTVRRRTKTKLRGISHTTRKAPNRPHSSRAPRMVRPPRLRAAMRKYGLGA